MVKSFKVIQRIIDGAESNRFKASSDKEEVVYNNVIKFYNDRLEVENRSLDYTLLKCFFIDRNKKLQLALSEFRGNTFYFYTTIFAIESTEPFARIRVETYDDWVILSKLLVCYNLALVTPSTLKDVR